MKEGGGMKRLYLSLDDRLYEEIMVVAERKGIPPTSLVVGNLEDLYMRTEAIDYDGLLEVICKEAKERSNEPFLLSELPSFSSLIVASADKAHISPSTIRARIGKSFNAAVKNGKVGNVVRAKKANGQ
ncbi:MAG: hypothetical protein K2O54_00270, partial [Prevotella sp.]|nr:hypothetical protein [Prevotella sp.]